MTIEKITAQEWSELLTEASKPKQQEGLPIKQYLAIHQPKDPKKLAEYVVVSAANLEDGEHRKLNLEEITTLSMEILKKDDKKTPESQVIIAKGIERISAAKAQRMHEARISRRVWRAISYLCFILLFSAAWGLFIKSRLDAPEEEIKLAKQFADHLRKENPSAYETLLRKEVYFESMDSLIQDKTDPKNYDKNIAQGYKEFIISEFRKAKPAEIQSAFQFDNARSVFHIVVKDGEMTHDAQRAEDLSDDLRPQFIDDQLKKFKELVGDDDNKWLALLQLVFTQQTFSAVVGPLIGSSVTFNPWKNVGVDYLQLRQLTPLQIQATIVRDESKKIKKLLVEATISTANFHTITGKKDEQIPGKAMNSTLQFEISLDSKQEPEIKILNYHHKMG